MTKRLQVLFEDAELREIQRAARHRRMTVAEWVRHALRSARAAEAAPDPRVKLEAVAVAVRHSFPTGDIERMLGEIEQGYVAERST
ncbi:MAG: antitoxin [Chloroflexi bacterium]|nr:antitoxin [Chloroflexota bacterium]